MKTIELRKTTKVAIVDDEDYSTLFKLGRWCLNSHGYAVLKGSRQLMHRLVMKLSSSELVCDHINRNRLDNRKLNLRCVTRLVNTHNRKPGEFGLYGIDQRINGVWRARISQGKKEIHLGVYSTKEEAARAYDEASIKLYGPLARLNFPHENS